MPRSFDMDPCDCGKGGAKLCCYVACCPCWAFQEAADNVTLPGQKSNGQVYCLGSLVPYLAGGYVGFFGRFVILTALTEEIAKKRGIDVGGPVGSALRAIADPFICHSCTLVHESRLYKQAKENKDEHYEVFDTNSTFDHNKHQTMDRGNSARIC